MTNSRQKGAAAEREVARILRDAGVYARRGRQYAGHPDAPDVVSGLERFHLEIKRRERGNVHDWLLQARADAGGIPAVWHRRNGERWIVSMDYEDWIELAKEVC